MEDLTAYYPSQQQAPPASDIVYPPSQYQYLPPPSPPLRYSHHLPPPSLHPPLPPFSHHPPPPAPPPPSSHDQLRTLFVAGFPDDVKPREIYNLFREFPGYLSSNLRSPSNSSQPFAFAVFSDQQSAVTAMHALNGMVFDLEKGSTLYIDLAKSNSRSKRQRTDDEGPASDKKHKGSPGYQRGSVELVLIRYMRALSTSNSLCTCFHAWALAGIGSFHIPGMGNSAYNMIGYPPAQSHWSYIGRGTSEASAARSSQNSTAHVPQDNPPCPTIFVANLRPNSSEQELTQVFSRCRGFLKLKIQGTYGAPVAFVDFQDTACSTEALSQLQGTVLFSSSTGDGMRLEYAKSRMGKRRKHQ